MLAGALVAGLERLLRSGFRFALAGDLPDRESFPVVAQMLDAPAAARSTVTA